jgi:hypothetical protein
MTLVHLSAATGMMDGMANDRAPATPLIGRVRELEQLLEAAGVTNPDARDVVLIGGDAGIGKTRLLRELGARARAAGHRVLAGSPTNRSPRRSPPSPTPSATSWPRASPPLARSCPGRRPPRETASSAPSCSRPSSPGSTRSPVTSPCFS